MRPDRIDILPPAQRDLLPALAPLKDLAFVLYGGTAIALRLGHRVSIDFDFVTDRPMDRDAMIARVAPLADATVLQDEPRTWTILTSSPAPVKISFFAELGFGRVGTPSLSHDGHLLVAALDDLLGHKLKVLLQRVEAKDYTDIAAMLRQGQTLAQGLGAAMALFPTLPPCEILRALTYFEGGDLAALPPRDRRMLVEAVRGLGSGVAGLAILSPHLDFEGLEAGC